MMDDARIAPGYLQRAETMPRHEKDAGKAYHVCKKKEGSILTSSAALTYTGVHAFL